ncbi:N-acetyltransferase ESCO2 isoform X1 [Ixodes scapularis]|uniref:N-acetyltransferase ESCO2 isoform X1 n=2 Tax=Ixodes scapularis TaxID=6945 RepID=UPI001AA0063A|nr:N-acetyltransferase ESCO2 isoform X1 [Ixodes scapularis]
MEEVTSLPQNADSPMPSPAVGMAQDPKRASTHQCNSFYSSKTTYLTPLERKRLRALENELPAATDRVESPAKKVKLAKLRSRKSPPTRNEVKAAATKSKKRPSATKINKKQTLASRARPSSVIVPLSESHSSTASNVVAGDDDKLPSKPVRKFFSSGLRVPNRGASATAVSWNGKFDLKFKRAFAATKSAGGMDVGAKKPVVMTVPFKHHQQDQKPENAVNRKPPDLVPSATVPERKTPDAASVPECLEDESSPSLGKSRIVTPQLEPGGRLETADDQKPDDVVADNGLISVYEPEADVKLKEKCKAKGDGKLGEDGKLPEYCKVKEDSMLKKDGKLGEDYKDKEDTMLKKDAKLGEESKLKDSKLRADSVLKSVSERKADSILKAASERKAGSSQIKDSRGGRTSANYSQTEADDKVGCSSFKVTTVSDDKPSCSKALIFISAEKENQKSACGADDTSQVAVSRASINGPHGEVENLKGQCCQEETPFEDILPLPEVNLTPSKQAAGTRNPLMAMFSDNRNSGGLPLYPVFSTPVHAQSRMGTRSRIKASPIAFQKKFLVNTSDPSQLIIDAGQKHFGPIACSTCGMVYSAGEMEDEKLHSRFHQGFMGVLKFPGWKKQREVGIYYDGKIIMVSFSDPKFMLKKMEEIGQMVDRNLGILEAVDGIRPPRMYFVFVSNDKKVLGFLVAQQIKEAYRVIPSESREITHNYLCESTPVPATCGVSRIWTAPFYRRKRVATRLLDRLRTNFSYGCLVELNELAFSDPTMMGRSFAAAYTRNDRFLVFR